MKQYLTLKNYTITVGVVFMLVVLGYNINHMPKTVTISSDRWKCGNPVPDGIESKCTTYIYIPTINEKLAEKAF